MANQQCLHLLGPIRINQIARNRNNPADNLKSKDVSWDTLHFRSKRAVAILGYLVAERRPVSRNYLAGLLWPDLSPSDGRANLRRELYSLGQLIPDCWQLERQAVAFSPCLGLKVDIYMLLEMEAEDNLTRAVDLLSGDFLEALHLENNLEFDSWLRGERNNWHWRTERILTQVIDGKILRGRYRDALQYCIRLLRLSPWNEATHQKTMRLLTWTGQRGAALHQFDLCRNALHDELDVDPSEETVLLYEKIRAGKLDLPPQLPAFLVDETARRHIVSPPIYAREHELERLHLALDRTIEGHGCVLFITGDAGSGKTVLMETFAQQAIEKHNSLLAAKGNCSAYSGIGEPYLPFRDIMATLTGDVEAKWDTGEISRDHASRLWEAFPIVVNYLLECAPNSLGVLVQDRELRERAAVFDLTSSSHLQTKINELITHQPISIEDFRSSFLFQQIAKMFQEISKEHPLLLMFDDIQWADNASTSLLFHLGRRFSEIDNRILMLCAFRPEEIFIRDEDGRAPLVKLINEFTKIFGKEYIDLGQSSGAIRRRLINAILDSEPNRFDEQFRTALMLRTGAHPLFTIELIRSLQERGDLYRDKIGRWNAAASLDWNILPTKVEAVIQERIERLDPKLQEILTIASVEGEVFTAEVVAKIQGQDRGILLRQLSMELEDQHRLVKEQEGFEIDGRYFSRYKFAHFLFQKFIYERLCMGERRLLHVKIANAIEDLYGNKLDTMVVKLAHHLKKAGEYDRAFRYFMQAARQAAGIYALEETIDHYSSAIRLFDKLSEPKISLAHLYQERGCIHETLGRFDLALNDFETALEKANETDNLLAKWQILINLGKLWASRDYHLTRECFDRALVIARTLDQPELIAENLNWLGNWNTNADEPKTALRYHQDALLIVKELGSPGAMANTLDLLGISHLMGGNLKQSAKYYKKAIDLYRKLDNRFRLISCLTGSAATYSVLALLTSVSTSSSSKAFSDLSEAISISEETHSSVDQSWPYWALGLLHTVQGRFEEAVKTFKQGLKIAVEIQHNEFIIGHHFGLGLVYLELFSTDLAEKHLQKMLGMAKELDSRIHVSIACGLLARAYILNNEVIPAQNYLDKVITSQTPMDTLGKRLCWVRKAEIALVQEKPEIALEIIDRLINTTPGIEMGDVVTYLWMLKGGTLSRLGLLDQALTYLKAAVLNAQKKEEKFLLWHAHKSLGQLYMSINNSNFAEKEISSAMSIVESIAGNIMDEHLKEKFLKGACHTMSSRSF